MVPTVLIPTTGLLHQYKGGTTFLWLYGEDITEAGKCSLGCTRQKPCRAVGVSAELQVYSLCHSLWDSDGIIIEDHLAWSRVARAMSLPSTCWLLLVP